MQTLNRSTLISSHFLFDRFVPVTENDLPNNPSVKLSYAPLLQGGKLRGIYKRWYWIKINYPCLTWWTKNASAFPNRKAGYYKNSHGIYVSGGRTTRDNEKCLARTVADSYTKEITQNLANEMTKLTDIKAHLIINELHRSKFDGNRAIHEATFVEPIAMEAYHDYHAPLLK